jgi:fibro-slime domain-containing protein
MLTFRHISGLLALALTACSIDASGMQAITEAPWPSGSDDDGDQGPSRDADAAAISVDDTHDAGDSSHHDGDDRCGRGLELVIRDFTEAHPDFERAGTDDRGIVRKQLANDSKPIYWGNGPTLSTSGPTNFAQWYNDVPGVNKRLSYTLEFTETSPGVFVYDNAAFFPIDDMGFGNGPKGLNLPFVGNTVPDHNFLFTTEAHLKFTYSGGEDFTFRGDDDMWVFINGKLALDLGGTHAAETASVSLDQSAAELGIKPGGSYAMDIFHAERHTTESNYRIETTIDLSCVQNVPIR